MEFSDDVALNQTLFYINILYLQYISWLWIISTNNSKEGKSVSHENSQTSIYVNSSAKYDQYMRSETGDYLS